MASGSGHMVPSGSDSWGRSKVSNGTEFSSYQPTKTNIWNDMDVFSSSWFIRKRTPDDAGTFFFLNFASNKSHCKSQWTFFILSLLQNAFMTTDYYSITLRAHILSNHHRRWHSIISDDHLFLQPQRAHGTEHSSLHYKDQSGWQVINEHGSSCKTLGIFVRS